MTKTRKNEILDFFNSCTTAELNTMVETVDSLRLKKEQNKKKSSKKTTPIETGTFSIPKPKKIKETIEVLFILDESYSMDFIVEETITSYNKLIDEFKNKSNIYLKLVKFNSHIESFSRKQISEDEKLNRHNYIPITNTKLYDAIVIGIKDLKSELKTAKINPKSVLVFIFSDGKDNESKNESLNEFYRLKKECEEMEWKFTFFGMGDAMKEAEKLKIKDNVRVTSMDQTMKHASFTIRSCT